MTSSVSSVRELIAFERLITGDSIMAVTTTEQTTRLDPANQRIDCLDVLAA
jgi:hypothetical protein